EDRNIRAVPAGHVRAALWQAAVHGQSASTIWVWDRTFDPRSDFSGSILERPLCAEAVGLVNCDLNRAAREMTALQQAKPDVLLLHCTSSLVWEGARHTDCRGKLYEALAFAGLKTGFLTERQLEAGHVPDASVIFVPDAVHLSDAARATLRKFRRHLVLVGGSDVLSRDEYDGKCEPIASADRLPWQYGKTKSRELAHALGPRLVGWGERPRIELRTESGEPVWGICCRSVATAEGLIVNLCNEGKNPTTFRMLRDGKGVAARDVLLGTEVGATLTLQPLQPRLLRLDKK
ncbi:MAG: hypothetical protein ACP5XB_22035, partial [Isosphaeraceae bacterium]